MKSDQPNFNPKQINVDFEQAAIKAAKEVFGSSKIQGCYFHLLQSVIRNLGTNQLKERYETDVSFASEIRQMTGVAFLPIDKVRLLRQLKCVELSLFQWNFFKMISHFFFIKIHFLPLGGLNLGAFHS